MHGPLLFSAAFSQPNSDNVNFTSVTCGRLIYLTAAGRTAAILALVAAAVGRHEHAALSAGRRSVK